MTLRPGLRVRLPAGDDPSARFGVSAGTGPPPSELTARYAAGAVVPRTPWRLPTADEARLLLPDAEPVGLAWLAVVRLPDEVLAPFARLKAAAPHGVEAVLAELLADPHRAAIDGVKEFARRLAEDAAAPLHESGVAVTPPGLPTGTAGRDRMLIGMHVDSWYRQSIAERASSPNRVAVNLGAEDRHFLFVNLPLGVLAAETLGPDAADAGDGAVPEIRRRFFVANPGYPVIRIRVRPGEAYIAPTENVLHDGSTLGMTCADVNLSVRGRLVRTG